MFSSTRLGSDALDGLDNVHSLNDRSEDDVFSVEPRSLVGAQEKLGTVSVGTGVGHREDTGSSMAELEVLVLEFVSVDRFDSSTVVVCEVTSLANNQFTTLITTMRLEKFKTQPSMKPRSFTIVYSLIRFSK